MWVIYLSIYTKNSNLRLSINICATSKRVFFENGMYIVIHFHTNNVIFLAILALAIKFSSTPLR